MTDADLPLRQAARGLMIDHADRVLMVKLHLERNGWAGWVLPGGGVEPGEEPVAALRRELHEETGLVDAFVGPVVCHRRQYGLGIAPGFGGQEDVIHLVPCHEFSLAPALAEHELRGEGIVDMRWFSVAELHTTSERLVPEGLPQLVERVLEFGGSVDPLIIEVTE